MNSPISAFFNSDPLDNFRDLAERTKIKEKGVFSNDLGFEYQTTVSLGGLDDLVLVIEQDYYLNRIVTPKLPIIHKDANLLGSTIKLTEMYLTASSQNGVTAEKVKSFALTNLNLIG